MNAARCHRRPERAAALPEYALLVALVAVVCIGALGALQSSASATFRDTASELGAGPDGAAPTDPGPDSPGPAPAPPTPGPATAPPTTTPPTTAPPAPTTTTTVARATTATAGFGAATSSRDRSTWTAAATLSVTDDRGRPVRDAEVTVRVEYRIGTGSWRTADEVDGETDDSGTIGLRTADLPRTGRDAVSSLRYTLVDLEATGLTWAGGASSVTISAP